MFSRNRRGMMDEEFKFNDTRDHYRKHEELLEDLQKTRLYFEAIVEGVLPLKKWGFEYTYKDFSNDYYPVIIIDNESCRVKLTYEVERFKWNDTIRIYYGRKHASNTDYAIQWQGERCQCWHQIDWDVIHFLDLLHPNLSRSTRILKKASAFSRKAM